MREERDAVEFVGGSGALCAGVEDAAVDVVAFMTRFLVWALESQVVPQTFVGDASHVYKRQVFPIPRIP
jgi:hypothetical protein